MSANEQDRARRVAERLLAELTQLIRSFPVERRTVSEMSRWLGVTRPVCQRVAMAARHRGDPLAGLARLPGVQGLASFVHAARRAACDRAAVDALEAAANRYADLVDEHGGSQSRLVAAIEASLESDRAGAPGPPPRDTTDVRSEARRLMFEGARGVTGREFETQAGVFLYRPRPADPDRVDGVSALAILGARMRAGAMPICPVGMFAQGRPDAPEAFAIRPITDPGDSPLPLGTLDEFSSNPPARVIARRSEERVSVLIEPAGEGPLDAVLAARFLDVAHPALHDPRMQTCYLHSDGPSRRLVITAFVHRAMAMRSVAMAGGYVRERVGARVPGSAGRVHVLTPRDLWADRLPETPRLEYLGLGLEQVRAGAYPRQHELLARLFELQAWAPEEFVGFQIQVEYPVWNAQYLINFDFGVDEQTR